jgi:hypothetical protein
MINKEWITENDIVRVISPFSICNNQQFDFLISLKMTEIVDHDLKILPKKQSEFNYFHPK